VPRPLAGNVMALACMLAWSTNFPIAGHLLKTWHPLLLTPVRNGVAALCLVLVCIIVGKAKDLLRIPLKVLLPSSFLALGFSTYGFIWSQELIDPVLAAIIVSAMPLFSLALGWLAGSERLTPQIMAGIALAIVGGFIVSRANTVENPLAGSTWIGAAVMLAAVGLYVWYTRTMVNGLPDIPDLPKAAASMTAVTLFCLLISGGAVAFGLVPVKLDLTPPNLYLALWLGAVAVGLSTALWFLSARHIGVTVATMHHNLVPFYVILIGLASGAAITSGHVVGAALVIAGVILAQFKPRVARQPAA